MGGGGRWGRVGALIHRHMFARECVYLGLKSLNLLIFWEQHLVEKERVRLWGFGGEEQQWGLTLFRLVFALSLSAELKWVKGFNFMVFACFGCWDLLWEYLFMCLFWFCLFQEWDWHIEHRKYICGGNWKVTKFSKIHLSFFILLLPTFFILRPCISTKSPNRTRQYKIKLQLNFNKIAKLHH